MKVAVDGYSGEGEDGRHHEGDGEEGGEVTQQVGQWPGQGAGGHHPHGQHQGTHLWS